MKAKLTKQPKPAPHQLGGIVERSPSELKPWPNNPRTHSEKQLAKLAASMQEFGFTAPVLVDEAGVILSGHRRIEAAARIGLPTVATRVLSGLTATRKRAYVIADNQLAHLSTWDDALLKGELEFLIQEDFAIELTGFSTAEIDILLDDPAQAASSDPDDLQPEDVAPEVVSRSGDLWRLADHLILCGNAHRPEDYARVMRGEPAQMAITDPPYNVPIAGHVCGNGKVKHKEFAMASGEMSSTEFIEFLRAAFVPIHAACQDGAVNFFFMDWRHAPEILAAAQPLFGPPRQLCVWVKDNAGMGTFYRSQRIRDKIAASKRKGMWMGGMPPIGYEAKDRSLAIVEAQADQVREIYRLYLQVICVRALKAELDRMGWITAARVSRRMKGDGGRSFSRGHLYRILSNPIYVGRIAHRTEVFAGNHPAIIEQEVWREVQDRLAANRQGHRVRAAANPSLLAGLVFDEQGERLTPSHAKKGSLRYRYYVAGGCWKLGAMQDPRR